MLYLRRIRSFPPHVEKRGRKYVLCWGGDDEVVWVPGPEVMTLCNFVSQECMAASIFFEHGALPGNVPWDRQPWWRISIWLAFQAGRADASDPDYRPPRKQKEQVWVRTDGGSGDSAGFPLGRVVDPVGG